MHLSLAEGFADSITVQMIHPYNHANRRVIVLGPGAFSLTDALSTSFAPLKYKHLITARRRSVALSDVRLRSLEVLSGLSLNYYTSYARPSISRLKASFRGLVVIMHWTDVNAQTPPLELL